MLFIQLWEHRHGFTLWCNVERMHTASDCCEVSIVDQVNSFLYDLASHTFIEYEWTGQVLSSSSIYSASVSIMLVWFTGMFWSHSTWRSFLTIYNFQILTLLLMLLQLLRLSTADQTVWRWYLFSIMPCLSLSVALLNLHFSLESSLRVSE